MILTGEVLPLICVLRQRKGHLAVLCFVSSAQIKQTSDLAAAFPALVSLLQAGVKEVTSSQLKGQVCVFLHKIIIIQIKLAHCTIYSVRSPAWSGIIIITNHKVIYATLFLFQARATEWWLHWLKPHRSFRIVLLVNAECQEPEKVPHECA